MRDGAGRATLPPYGRPGSAPFPLPCGEGLGVRVGDLRLSDPETPAQFSPPPSPQGKGRRRSRGPARVEGPRRGDRARQLRHRLLVAQQPARLPVRPLQDRPLLHDTMDRADCRAIVRALLRLADSLGIAVTAEGIETEDQRRALIAEGGRFGQGYLFGKPVPLAVQPGAAVGVWGCRVVQRRGSSPDARARIGTFNGFDLAEPLDLCSRAGRPPDRSLHPPGQTS